MRISEATHAAGSTLQTAFAAIRDFLTGTVGGWVAIDQTPIGGRTSCVFFSRGSSGLEDIYVRMEIDPAANCINFFCYLFWDELSHRGFNEAGIGAPTGATFPNPMPDAISCLPYAAGTYPSGLRMWGDRDSLHVFSHSRTTQGGPNSIAGNPDGGISVGLLDRTADDVQTYLSKPAYLDYTGPVVLHVVTTHSTGAGGNTFWPNKDYQIMSATRGSAQIETVRIAPGGVNHTARTLTINSLAGYYPEGSKIGIDPQPVAVSDAVFGTQRFWMPHSFTVSVPPAGGVVCAALHGTEPSVGESPDFVTGFTPYPSLYRTIVVTEPLSTGGRFEVRGLRKFAYVRDRNGIKSAPASFSDQNGRQYRVVCPTSFSGGAFVFYSFGLRIS